MREMILNHASLATSGWHDALVFLPDLAEGMAALVCSGVVQSTLRMSRSLYETCWSDERSLFDALQEVRRQGGRDQFLFLIKLSQKAPLLSSLAPEVNDRFLMCEAKKLPPHDGAPLVLCAVMDAVCVGFPSERVWDSDRLDVEFQELLSDGAFEDAHEEIDNLTRSLHASPIIDRHRTKLRRQCADAAEMWDRREQIFPHLTFGPDVEDHLAELNAGWLSTLVNRLADLDATAEEWQNVGGNAPPWRTRVTPESDRLMSNPVLREARRFRSRHGSTLLFEWHARFGSRARIHLRFDARIRQIEIGYIGVHLPT